MSLGLQSLAATQAAVLRSLQAPGSKLTARVTLPASNASARRPPLGVVRVTAQGNFNTEVEDKPTLQTDDSGDSSEKPSLTPTPNRERRNRPTIIRAADRRPGTACSPPRSTGPRREAPNGDRDSEGLCYAWVRWSCDGIAVLADGAATAPNLSVRWDASD
jgi:hypothetical protein